MYGHKNIDRATAIVWENTALHAVNGMTTEVIATCWCCTSLPPSCYPDLSENLWNPPETINLVSLYISPPLL